MVLQSGVYPQSLNLSRVIPLYKKGCVRDVCNYRPISLLPVLSKVIETIISKLIWAFLNKHDLLSSSQFVNKVNEQLDRGLFVCGVFFDLSKAFDSVNIKFVEIKNFLQ